VQYNAFVFTFIITGDSKFRKQTNHNKAVGNFIPGQSAVHVRKVELHEERQPRST